MAELAGGDAHILVVDDDDRIRTLLKRYLQERGYRVSTAPNADKALSTLNSLAFDLLVLDVMMPGMNGFELTEAVRRQGDTPILLLTARGEAEDRIKGLSLGADDYLAKPFEPEELILRINAILRRARPSTAAIRRVEFGDWSFDVERESLTRRGEPVRLTGGEAALLAALAASAGQTVSRLTLSERTGGGERAVDVQVTRLRRKIEGDPKEPLHLQTVRGEGYRLVADPVFED
ncbi:response regulator transcription factor [Maricaulis sp.]|jgi:two-component system phosphate regulon response regulator OmpR|uniref:response regulator n=1 Tax=Maricaulis sp. TaxID=1486257 RepID=UPI00262BE4B6|nr:response regulator transcription factor [Maricaulis sp.]